MSAALTRRGVRSVVLASTAALALGMPVAAFARTGTPLAASAGAQSSDPSPSPGFELPPVPQVPGGGTVPDPNQSGLPSIPGVTVGDQDTVRDPAQGGSFSAPFVQPGVSCPNETEGADASDPYNDKSTKVPTEGPASGRTNSDIVCKPAGVSVVDLPTPKDTSTPGKDNLLYWDGLESEENIGFNIVAEFGDKAANDQTRVLTLDQSAPRSSRWTTPTPSDGGADGAPDSQYLVPNAGPLAPILNDQGRGAGALFCSDQLLLSNGEVLVPGGTDYYAEPRIPGTAYGVAELQGLRNTRVYQPGSGRWYPAGEMNYGRWYPSLVTLGNGNVFVASGVTKLLKPAYDKPENALLSGTNVEQTETFDVKTGTWHTNAPSADHSLPLYPRLHLLPDGHVYYDAGGQTFNPFGQSYDEALWNLTASYDPATQKWSDLGVPSGVSGDVKHPLNAAATAGFRGSSFSMMMPLVPDAQGNYTKTSFLSAGGVLGVSPGAYLANSSSILNTVTTGGGKESFSSKATGALNNARWFSTGVVLPTGQTLAFNGGNRDDVLLPGTSAPVTQTEMFDPATNKWTPLAASGDPRTYHNTAVLLPSGKVLVGGHSPISTGYAYNTTLPGGFIKQFRDPSFQLYSPPYLHWGIAQPTITSVTGTHEVRLAGGSFDDADNGRTLTLTTPQAGSLDKVTLVRNTALTHEIDADQRTVQLPVVSHQGNQVTVKVPDSNVVPPGPYMLFVNQKTAKGDIPSVAKQLFVGSTSTPVPATTPSKGAAATDYQGVQTNSTPDQLAALEPFLENAAAQN